MLISNPKTISATGNNDTETPNIMLTPFVMSQTFKNIIAIMNNTEINILNKFFVNSN